MDRHDPDFAFFALTRLAHGATVDELDFLRSKGFGAWMEDQLTAPPGKDDPACAERLRNFQLRIQYPAGSAKSTTDGKELSWPARDEARPLRFLEAPIEAAWPLTDRGSAMDNAERRRPRDEVIAATLLRAVHSHYQLREVLVSFWHDHFNVDAFSADAITAALPAYDRDVIRRHCLGNFREMLEAVASSTAMLYYLSNRSSRAGAANENYARELFELHTLGRQAYLNDRYDRWREVPGALQGHPAGYIDQDVYEAARAFTGWTVEDGSRIDNHTELPKTGRFRYVEGWHDGYQKRVLASEMDPFGPPLGDGRRVLDLLAAHDATAALVCTKLCRRLVSDTPPKSLVQKAVASWKQHRKSADQIAQVVRTIVTSAEFADSRGAKVKRPVALAAGFARAARMDFVPSEGLANQLANCGERLFGWPTPVGMPDTGESQLGTNAMRQRWNLVWGLANNQWQNGFPRWDLIADGLHDSGALLSHWWQALNGRPNEAAVHAILSGLAGPPLVDTTTAAVPDQQKLLSRWLASCGMAPAFQVS